ncbi:MAG TPA: hypothetical protein VK864_11380, partial [Longimicrobiales bacterium]|nr:hypothetical protein [Longimicrobiales bacterium]
MTTDQRINGSTDSTDDYEHEHAYDYDYDRLRAANEVVVLLVLVLVTPDCVFSLAALTHIETLFLNPAESPIMHPHRGHRLRR